jgi:thymidine kinase
MTARITPAGGVVRDGQQVQIGGNDMYTALCRRHFQRGEAREESLGEARTAICA